MWCCTLNDSHHLAFFLFCWVSVLNSTVDISGFHRHHHYQYHHHTYLYAIRYIISSNICVQLTLILSNKHWYFECYSLLELQNHRVKSSSKQLHSYMSPHRQTSVSPKAQIEITMLLLDNQGSFPPKPSSGVRYCSLKWHSDNPLPDEGWLISSWLCMADRWDNRGQMANRSLCAGPGHWCDLVGGGPRDKRCRARSTYACNWSSESPQIDTCWSSSRGWHTSLSVLCVRLPWGSFALFGAARGRIPAWLAVGCIRSSWISKGWLWILWVLWIVMCVLSELCSVRLTRNGFGCFMAKQTCGVSEMLDTFVLECPKSQNWVGNPYTKKQEVGIAQW